MKKLIPFLGVLLMTPALLKAQTATITTSGFTFTPNELTIAPGTTVEFNIGGSHNALEISQQSWNSNNPTTNGGFNLPLGGGSVTFDDPGTYYYICVPHASMGMKGIITVQVPSAITDIKDSGLNFDFYPNPSADLMTIEFNLVTSDEILVRIYDLSGRVAHSLTGSFQAGQHVESFDISHIEAGHYVIIFSSRSEIISKPMVKM